MKKQDWHFSMDNYICNFRSVGVLILNNKILLQKDKNGTEYALPGGHVTIGETSEATLIREYKEETGGDIICERILWIEECFWKCGNKDAHTISFYYLISLKDISTIPDNDEFFAQKDNSNIMLKWVSLDEFNKLTIYPSFLSEKVKNISSQIEHFIYKE